MLVDFFWDVGHFKVFICNNIASVLYFGVFGLDARRILAPPRGIEPVPPALEGEVLATGPPGKSLKCFFLLSLKSLMTKQRTNTRGSPGIKSCPLLGPGSLPRDQLCYQFLVSLC